MKEHIVKNVLAALIIAVLAWCPFFLYRLAYTPYSMHQEAITRATKAESTFEKKQEPHWSGDVQFQPLKRQAGSSHPSWNVYSFEATIQPVRLKLICDGNLQDSLKNVTMKVGGDEVVGPWWRITENKKDIELGYEGPALNMMNTLTIQIDSKTPIRILNVQRWNKD